MSPFQAANHITVFVCHYFAFWNPLLRISTTQKCIFFYHFLSAELTILPIIGHLFIHSSISLSIGLSTFLSIYLFTYISVCLIHKVSERLTYKTPQGKRTGCGRIAAACETVHNRKRILKGSFVCCARTWCVAAMTAMKSVATTSKQSCKLIENKTIKDKAHTVNLKQLCKRNEGLKKS
jgi:hypothetical protein